MIGSIGSTSYDTTSVQQTRSDAAAKVFQAIDTDKDGKVTEDELSAAIQASGDKNAPRAAEIMKQLDQGNKGYITEKDLEAGMEKGAASGPPPGPPRGHAGGGRPAEGATTTTTYDPEDLNQDGTVTMQEKMEYAQKVYEAQKEAQAAPQASIEA